ncbi:MAG: hypothetical protein GX778_07425 [Erysipelothrix sp.]|nr:hypothetical protein [Erysipelothrix sp.]
MIKSTIASFLLGIISAHENFNLTIRKHEIPASETMNIVHLSDIHYPKQGVSLKSILFQTKQCDPTIICITGDLMDDSLKEMDQSLYDFLSHLKDIAPVLYVRGNHEVRIDKLINIEKKMFELGIINLNGNHHSYGQVSFYGIDELNRYQILDCNKEHFNVVLAHHPEDVYRLQEGFGIDIMLSGHAHGGQIRIGNHGLFAPGQGILPRYTKGLWQIHDRMRLNISAGIGMSSFKQRINNRPEIVLIRLKG